MTRRNPKNKKFRRVGKGKSVNSPVKVSSTSTPQLPTGSLTLKTPTPEEREAKRASMNPNSDRQKSLDQNGTDVRREYTVQGETTHSEPRHRPPQPQNRTPTAIPDVDVTHDQDLRTSKTVSPEDLEKLSNLLGAGKDTEAEEDALTQIELSFASLINNVESIRMQMNNLDEFVENQEEAFELAQMKETLNKDVSESLNKLLNHWDNLLNSDFDEEIIEI